MSLSNLSPTWFWTALHWYVWNNLYIMHNVHVTCVALYYRPKMLSYTCGSRSFQFWDIFKDNMASYTYSCMYMYTCTCIFDEFHCIPERTKAPMEVRARKLVVIQNLLKEWLRKRRIRDMAIDMLLRSVWSKGEQPGYKKWVCAVW